MATVCIFSFQLQCAFFIFFVCFFKVSALYNIEEKSEKGQWLKTGSVCHVYDAEMLFSALLKRLETIPEAHFLGGTFILKCCIKKHSFSYRRRMAYIQSQLIASFDET